MVVVSWASWSVITGDSPPPTKATKDAAAAAAAPVDTCAED